MFQVERARPLALIVGLVLAGWCAGAEPPSGLPVPPLPSPSATSSRPSSVPVPLLPPPARVDALLGVTGRSGVLPTEGQQDPHFVPVEDRWRIGFPEWDRYGKGHPITDDYPYMPGRKLDPFNQNVLKGDFPICGQHTFL